ncbi:protein FAR-RED IMPAIRED RESPONSE 1-like [Carya illinoinensis]|uniref:protein FAR-RED IMPAIRED RESPONSE 1-like n=1 Tax=Carya illinoinensis TaxID=32201 RepID=UPI001C71A9D1|nr:protein FAR-RED IMPAIRED RESPONSE 1-like [Carya illinoinensis]
MGKGGGEALNNYFKRMRKMNDGFVFVMDVDDEFRVRNVFWADARSRAAYEVFGDIITFVQWLISSKDTSTFVWLFEAWLECMNGRAPQAIITDKDRAMKNAIGIVFPQTRHKYCLWHIIRKWPEKLGFHSEYDASLKVAIQNAIYDTQPCDEFDKKWQQLILSMTLWEMHGWRGCTRRGLFGYWFISKVYFGLTYRRIFVEESQNVDPKPAEEVGGGIDEVVIPTQCSNLTQVRPPASDQAMPILPHGL